MVIDVDKLYRLRKTCGHSQMDVAASASIQLGTYSKIENGQIKNPSIDTIAKIAAVLNVSIDYLIKKEENS